MKRILMSGLLCTISIFFTGCSSLFSSKGKGYQELKWDVLETEENKADWGEAALKEGETAESKEMPDYYETNESTKYEELPGKRAFKFADGHSEEVGDIEDFEIGTMLEDGTFIYGYSTKQSGTDDNRKSVHCVAAYQYDTDNFKVIHENVFNSVDESEESFYIQMCDQEGTSNQSIFVYDNGVGYLYTGSIRVAHGNEHLIEWPVTRYINKEVIHP